MISNKLAQQPVSFAVIVDALALGACAVDHANRIAHANARWNPALSSLPAVTRCFAAARERGRAEIVVELGSTSVIVNAGVLDADGTLLVTQDGVGADAALQEERYHATLETVRGGIVLTDREGEIQSHNAQLPTILQVDTLVGQSLYALIAQSDAPRLQNAYAEALTSGSSELEVHGPEASEASLIAITLRWLPRGETMLGFLLDVTEQRSIEARALQAQRMDSLGNLAAGISHDFNNLLTVIGLSLSEAAKVAGDEAMPLLRAAAEATETATELTQQLLTIGRSTDVTHKPVAVQPLVQDLFELLKRTSDPNVEFAAEVDPEAILLGSESQIHQVLFNLGLNGIEAMPGGGKLQIECARAAHADVPGQLPLRPDGYLRLICRDTGEGMDPSVVDRIFEPYFSTKGDSGNGLGLAMVNRIVRDHDGAIEVQSAAGQGTSMVIYLPAAAAESTEERTEQRSAPRSRMPARHLVALVVDDREELRSICSAMLRRAGFGVLEASSGDDALRLVTETGTEPDLALIDAAMPGMSGRETVEALRDRFPAIKVLLMSGFAPSTIEGYDPVEMSFLQKPFDSDALMAGVQEALAAD